MSFRSARYPFLPFFANQTNSDGIRAIHLVHFLEPVGRKLQVKKNVIHNPPIIYYQLN